MTPMFESDHSDRPIVTCDSWKIFGHVLLHIGHTDAVLCTCYTMYLSHFGAIPQFHFACSQIFLIHTQSCSPETHRSNGKSQKTFRECFSRLRHSLLANFWSFAFQSSECPQSSPSQTSISPQIPSTALNLM